MYYFINYKLFPVLAKYKAIWWYATTAVGLICFYFVWLYTLDIPIKKTIAFYDKKLTELQSKQVLFAGKKNTIALLIEQKDNLSLFINNEQKKVLLLWNQLEDIFSTYALNRSLTINSISVTKQSTSKTLLKKSIFLVLQGSLHNIFLFLEDIENNESFRLEQLSLHIESENNITMNCSYIIQKIKTLQL